MSGAFVTFRLAGRVMAAPLHEVREVVRATGIEPLLGAVAPIAGLLELRGEPLPVADPRPIGGRAEQADVLVLLSPPSAVVSVEELISGGAASGAAGPLGVVVDEVLEVLDESALPAMPGSAPAGLPDYVVEVRRNLSGAPILVVDPRRLAWQ